MFDIIIIGAGIVGLAIAKSIAEKTHKSVLVIE
ncbi:MAG: NAD(P)-binding protein, partial [Candidatus Marinimicrobia bacterium]|nr:NAD(P)-binding protein [Candidatus Neomarinimicrobiota bacterium]